MSVGQTNATLRSRNDLIFDVLNYFVLSAIAIIVLYPLYFVFIASISNPTAVLNGEMWIWPKGITMEGYSRIIQEGSIWRGYQNTILYTSVGTAINVLLTVLAGYALSRKDLYGRNTIMVYLLITMFFSGGLIPTYLVIKKLHLINTMWALILPKAVSLFNIIIARSFFQDTIPVELLEAAKMDGCSDVTFFAKIVLPLSKAIIAVLALFYAVGYWNSFFDALIYLGDERMYPLQLVLRNLLVIQNELASQFVTDVESAEVQQRVASLLKYGVIVIASLPLLIVYPFIQRYFVQGVMIGSVKG
ncbi:carbohydrate ABC transporter permease [Paenibacillus mucilaginosus]|uniref:Sugar ABC transporter permease n=2 Tax=Paenibacillus mucilaginosus TaxID=61624 RepID=I0BFX0_9BACL|nr:carbohydrate ABC transporter permease [Paenibacillus mucilaginosus]AEI40442.1 binding-protein-dependent transport system inner membrane component [Paenibacillus mucilaginosus KNP414]AFH61267.1 sugar ABC transporter permease [Paenibacillus mucilaginosus K02]MCG7213214.1 carbohydrate ABC transporter permease [Paenibacillus mucilaginosus]WDM29620.1 carbohydrate ABC transporter permease [Paenibacillus mucilaginosus]WFA17800.1 carbohydrate ABC transporter permease [Paenibacillus mucilaginosus]